MSIKKIPAALIGFGVVGEGLYRQVRERKYPYLDIRHIVVRDPGKKRPLPESRFSFDPKEIWKDPEIELVIELISDAEVAFEVVKTALLQGKNVVTANKKMVSEHLHELIELQQLTGGVVLYEAAVCGSIPIVHTLDRYFGWDEVQEVSGIFNGTSNYILSEFDRGKEYATALREAQLAGFAEADPTLDVGGYDPAFKLILLTLHAFGKVLRPEQVFFTGIQRISFLEAAYAGRHGYAVKLIASVVQTEEGLQAFVLPTFLSEGHALAGVSGEENAVRLITERAGPQGFQGKGAGAQPTALAVLADVERYRIGERYAYVKGTAAACVDDTAVLPVYVRLSVGAPSPRFQRVFEQGRVGASEYVVGEVTLKELLQLSPSQRNHLFIARLPEEHTLLYANKPGRKPIREVVAI